MNLETVGEQKAMVDHVMENFTRLSQMAREAQSTLKALQAERELAERIERSNKQLKARGTGSVGSTPPLPAPTLPPADSTPEGGRRTA
jgi:hypothetical protein